MSEQKIGEGIARMLNEGRPLSAEQESQIRLAMEAARDFITERDQWQARAEAAERELAARHEERVAALNDKTSAEIKAGAAGRSIAALEAALDSIKRHHEAPKLHRDSEWLNDLSGAINDAVYGDLNVILAAYAREVAEATARDCAKNVKAHYLEIIDTGRDCSGVNWLQEQERRHNRFADAIHDRKVKVPHA